MDLYKISDRIRHPFIAAYYRQQSEIIELYDWSSEDTEQYQKRAKDIQKLLDRSGFIADRSQVAKVLKSYHRMLALLNRQAEVDPQILTNLVKYSQGAITIVSGQQAGLYTGPLYTINKIVSLLKQTEYIKATHRLDVVPVFWIAGEDHDIDEVDHAYFALSGQLKKTSIDWEHKPRTSVAEVKLSKEETYHLIRDLKQLLPDSLYKQMIIEELYAVYSEVSMSIAFAALLYRIFAPFGLVIIDAHDEQIRELEVEAFAKMVDLSGEVQVAIKNGFKEFAETSYQPQVVVDQRKTGLYMNLHDRRYPINYEHGNYYIERVNSLFSKEQLLERVRTTPSLFSTNALLRPIMQEYLFQPLIYIGGQAEVMYWGQLRPLFHLFGYKMPIVQLRNSYTYMTATLMNKLHKYQIDPIDVLQTETFAPDLYIKGMKRENFDIAAHFQQMQSEIAVVYHQYLDKIPEQVIDKQWRRDLDDKYWKIMTRQMRRFEKDVAKHHDDRYSELHTDIQSISHELLPGGGLQERTLNVYQFINQHGYQFITDLLANTNDFGVQGEHYLVYL